ncbi:MAG: NUDIX domain-containing protein [Parcubacteria group bacterium GW2011_GWA1_36_12]|nr:MAG: NUDIX domain-containing protein [Parcubacteria group bacterium GW2011_GWA1_36_12]
MEIKSTLINRSGQVLNVVYREGDPLADLGDKILQGVHAFCLYKGKMVLVLHSKSGWMPPGGGIEPGETYEEAVVREVTEETNMKVIHQVLIGFQDIYEPERIVRQTRSFCIVEPFGKFVSDPDGEITNIKLIDPKDYKRYFDWGEIGEKIMEKAMELKSGVSVSR